MPYSIKEIYYTLQGEGYHTGRPAVFCRFAGCNLWSGREMDRAKAVCSFCDTDFVGMDGPGGGKFVSTDMLVAAVTAAWPEDKWNCAKPFVVCTGGEPLLQLDDALLAALHKRGFEVAVETNGTFAAPSALDWICVSPKAGTDLVQTSGNELKLVYPQKGVEPEEFEHLSFDHFFLQPMDGTEREQNTRLAATYCLENPRWRLSLQSHKIIGIP